MQTLWTPGAGTAADDHIADTLDAHDASAISILDTAADFTATDVEGALAELQADAEAHAADVNAHHDVNFPLMTAPVSITNLGAGPTDLAVNNHAAIDLAPFTDIMVMVNQTASGGGTGDFKLQYATDDTTWADLTSNLIDLATAAAIKTTAWEAIPAGAKAAPVGIRFTGINGNGTEDHTLKFIGIRLR